MWCYYAHSLEIVGKRLDAAGFPERNFSDLYPRWLGARELLLHGRDPYSPEITREIQRGYYGRPIDSSRPTDPIDEQRFAYPLFVVFLLVPVTGLQFALVKSLFFLILFAAAVTTILLWIRVMDLRIGQDKILLCVGLAVASIPYLEGLQLQQLSILEALFLAGAAYTLVREQFVSAGVLLALATIRNWQSIA